MFSITAESCRRFSLADILVMVAMNKVESVRMAPRDVRSKTAVSQRA